MRESSSVNGGEISFRLKRIVPGTGALFAASISNVRCFVLPSLSPNRLLSRDFALGSKSTTSILQRVYKTFCILSIMRSASKHRVQKGGTFSNVMAVLKKNGLTNEYSALNVFDDVTNRWEDYESAMSMDEMYQREEGELAGNAVLVAVADDDEVVVVTSSAELEKELNKRSVGSKVTTYLSSQPLKYQVDIDLDHAMDTGTIITRSVDFRAPTEYGELEYTPTHSYAEQNSTQASHSHQFKSGAGKITFSSDEPSIKIKKGVFLAKPGDMIVEASREATPELEGYGFQDQQQEEYEAYMAQADSEQMHMMDDEYPWGYDEDPGFYGGAKKKRTRRNRGGKKRTQKAVANPRRTRSKGGKRAGRRTRRR